MISQGEPEPLNVKGNGDHSAGDVEITLLVPVYNEDHNIVPLVQEIKQEISLPHQIVIVYDSEDDTTLRKRDILVAIDPDIAFVRNTSGGVINAFRTGFNVAKTRYVVPIM